MTDEETTASNGVILHWQGHAYDFDGDFTMSEAKTIKRNTGMTLGRLQAGLADLDPDAMCAFVWTILSRHHATGGYTFDTLDFTAKSFAEMLEAIPAHPDGEADPTAGGHVPPAETATSKSGSTTS